MNATPVLSLVTGTRNRETDFRRLVRSIEQNTTVDWELIVSDASDYPINETGLPWNVLTVPERPRLGHTKGFNRAFSIAAGEWVIYLNDDCEVLPGYADAAISFMQAHPEIGLGALSYSNKGGPFKVNSNSFDGMTYANFGIIRRTLGNSIGWFDDVVEMYGADNTLGFRVLLAGFGIAEIQNARILHHESQNAERHNLAFRMQQGEALKAKYLPYLAQMRETYERTKLVSA